MKPIIPTLEQALAFAREFEDPYCTVVEACARVGVGRLQYYRWLDYADAGKPAYQEFARIVVPARMAQARHLEECGATSANNGNGPGVSWYKWQLQVRHKRTHGDYQRLEHTGADGKPITTETRAGLTPETAQWMRREVLGIGVDKDGDGDDT